jgi:geranylgeranyl diphosphate synthase, type I
VSERRLRSERTISTASAPPILGRARHLFQPALRKAIGLLDPLLRTPVEYHFGWVEPDGTPIDTEGGGSAGKAVRPALAILGAEAAGGDAAVAVPGAVALELIHNFSLIHDDIMDGDRTRRHRPTVWDVYGVADAIIVGDALHTLAFDVLLDEPSPAAAAAMRCLADATAAMIAGQAQDSALDRRPDGTVADCVTMQRNKTAAVLGASVTIGAVLAGAPYDVQAALERYGSELGLAFQAIDDVLGIWGDPQVTGKPIGGDLRERKKSLPVVLGLAAGGELADELRDAFHHEMTDDVIASLSERLAAAGIRQQVEARADVHIAAALQALASQPLATAASEELATLAQFIVDRRY